MKKYPIIMALLGAAALIALAQFVTYLSANGTINPEQARRAMGAVFGFIFIVMGNSLPKKLSPLSDKRCGSANGQSRRRFAGWTFVIAGIIYSLSWLVAPMEFARTIAMSAGIVAVALVMGSCFLSKSTGNHSQPTS